MSEVAGVMCRMLESLGFSEGLAQRLAAERDAGKIAPPRTCPVLRDDEEGCVDGAHPIAGKRNSFRRCRLLAYRAERRRLSAQLALCGYPEHADEAELPIAAELWRGIDQGRAVKNLREELRRIAEYRRQGWDKAGHLALVGSMGVVKSHVLLSLYFDALWAGVSGWWLTMADLRQLAKELDSHNERIAHDAEYRLSGWQKRQLLVIDDIGDRLTDQRSRDGGSTKAAAVLLDLLNAHSGKRMFASNLNSDQLADHPDVGARTVSRLFGDHRVELADKSTDVRKCLIVALYGDDQRQHLLRQGDRL